MPEHRVGNHYFISKSAPQLKAGDYVRHYGLLEQVQQDDQGMLVKAVGTAAVDRWPLSATVTVVKNVRKWRRTIVIEIDEDEGLARGDDSISSNVLAALRKSDTRIHLIGNTVEEITPAEVKP